MDNTQFTEEQQLEAWRHLHAGHLNRQTRAIEQIRNYVTIWFWLSVAGAVLFVLASASAASRF
jgi:hypothetical protein